MIRIFLVIDIAPAAAVVRLRAVCHLARVQVGPEHSNHAVHADPPCTATTGQHGEKLHVLQGRANKNKQRRAYLPAVRACGVAMAWHWLGATIHVLWGTKREYTIGANGDGMLLAPVPGESPVQLHVIPENEGLAETRRE